MITPLELALPMSEALVGLAQAANISTLVRGNGVAETDWLDAADELIREISTDLADMMTCGLLPDEEEESDGSGSD